MALSGEYIRKIEFLQGNLTKRMYEKEWYNINRVDKHPKI